MNINPLMAGAAMFACLFTVGEASAETYDWRGTSIQLDVGGSQLKLYDYSPDGQTLAGPSISLKANQNFFLGDNWYADFGGAVGQSFAGGASTSSFLFDDGSGNTYIGTSRQSVHLGLQGSIEAGVSYSFGSIRPRVSCGLEAGRVSEGYSASYNHIYQDVTSTNHFFAVGTFCGGDVAWAPWGTDSVTFDLGGAYHNDGVDGYAAPGYHADRSMDGYSISFGLRKQF